MVLNIVVTGGAGFIGSNIASRLVSEGHDVTVIDDLSTGRSVNIDHLEGKSNFRFIRGSITDEHTLRQAIEGADHVLHQAAIPSVPRSVMDPISSNRANVDGTLNVFVVARDCGVKSVVYASSSSVYGDTPSLPKREDMVPNPQSPYAVTKLTGEHYGRLFRELYGLRTIGLRYFNVYGPRQDPNSQYAAVIPRFVTKALRGERPTIFGDGAQSRDFTFVQDVVDANLKAMYSSSSGTFNISGGTRVTLLEILEKIGQIMGVSIVPIFEPKRQGDILHSHADISAANSEFGYAPQFSLEQGLQETIKWYKSSEMADQ